MVDINCGIEMSFSDFCNAPVVVKSENDGNNLSKSELQDSDTEVNSAEGILMNEVARPTIKDILGVFRSGVGIDISKNHTGLCLWRDGRLETLGFAVDMDYDRGSYLAEARMRKEFKDKLRGYLQGYDWEVCIVEDVYGGTNFDTTRKLLALNCVVDELILDNEIKIDYLYRFKESEWLKDMRKIAKFGNKLNPKYECQKILEYLNFDLVIEHKDDRKKDLLDMFYEDRCDAVGQLLGLAMRLSTKDRNIKSGSVQLRDLKIYFIESDDDIFLLDDYIVVHSEIVTADYTGNSIEDCLLELSDRYPDKVVSILVDTDKLGTFGVLNGFNYYEQGYGYLIFYNKKGLHI